MSFGIWAARRPAWALLAVGASAIAAAGESRAADEPAARQGIHWPGEGGRRVAVAVGITVIDFAHVDEQDEAFEMAGYLDLTWVDPTLAAPAGSVPPRRRFRKGDIWSPELEFVNATEQVESERHGDLYVGRDGGVEQRVRFSHKFRSALHLKRFPFDSQSLTVVIAPFDTIARDIKLVLEANKTGKLPGASIPDWRIDGEAARVVPVAGGDPDDREFRFEVRVTRRSTFYFWRVFLPLALLVAASWSVFWVDEEAAPAKFGTAVTVLVSLVAFSYTVDFSLPKVPYLTFADVFSFTAFAYILSVIFAVTAIHFTHRRAGAGPAGRLERVARVGFPASFVALILLETFVLLG